MYDSSKSEEDIVSVFKRKGKRIVQANCTARVFPQDGGISQSMPVGNNLTVGVQLQLDSDIPFANVWFFLPIVDSTDCSSAPKSATYNQVRQNLEEFIICTKSCFIAYEKLHGNRPNARSASGDQWLATYYQQIFFALEDQWDVNCRGIEVDPSKCKVEIITRSVTVSSGDQTSTEDNCFVVTATFGTPYEPEVAIYRHFRDEYLSKFKLGKIFISIYYGGLGEKLSKLVKRNRHIKIISTFLLCNLAKILPNE